VILRLAPVYGAGRGIRARLRKATTDPRDGTHAISRIQIDDVIRVVNAAEERAPTKSLFSSR